MITSARSKTRSSLRGKQFVTVIFDIPAASATWEIVTSSKPLAANSAIATPEMACRASCFRRSRSPVVMPPR